MKKEYTIKELQSIFGCSRTAIVKKIKEDVNNPGVKRYKDRYEVVTSNGQMAIIFDDEDLEHEKRLSKGMAQVSSNGYNTAENDNIIDIEPNVTNSKEDKLLDFTKRYIEDYTTLQKTFYDEMRERDKQILLLTTSENNKQTEYLQTIAENKTLKKRNTVLLVITGVAITVLICFITFFVTYITLHNTPQETPPAQSNPVQTVTQPPAPVQPAKKKGK